MTEAQKEFVKLEEQKEAVKLYFEKLAAATEKVAAEIGIGGYFQDDKGIVYKVVVPEGRFINYEKISYVRTRRVGEERGTLSLKEAKQAGYAPAESE